MAVTTINLSDPVSTWVNKTNTIATNVGDLATLSTSDTASLVAAINEINALVDGNLNDSSEIQGIFTAGQGLTYNNTGEYSIADSGITSAMLDNDIITERHIASGVIINSHLASGAVDASAIAAGAVGTSELADSSITQAKMAQNSVTSTELADLETLLIKNSSGTTLKTMFSPGS